MTCLMSSAHYLLKNRHTAFNCYPLPLAAQPIFSPSNGPLDQPTFPSFQVRMPWERVTKALWKSRYITTTSTPLSTESLPGIAECNQGGEAQFALLTIPDYLCVLYVFGKGFHDNVPHDPSTDWSKADWLQLPEPPSLPLLRMGVMLASSS